MESDTDETQPAYACADPQNTVFDNKLTDSVENGFTLCEEDSKATVSDSIDRAGGSTLSQNDDTVGLNKAKIKDTDREKFASGWFLEEKDLRCLPLVLNKKRLQELKAQKKDQVWLPKQYSYKSYKSHTRGSTRKNSGKGYSHLTFSSPLSMIASFAKQSGYDLSTVLETSDYLVGKRYHLPCMQCFEKYRRIKGAGFESSTDAANVRANKSYGRCPSCGGLLQTMASFGKVIKQMRQILDAKDLVPYDVYADENCLFGAIVDQLRLRGDFSFTPYSLRLSAVKYLRDNPTSDDGTPLQMFLTGGETWSSYLARMSRDGESCDHIFLRALANIIGMQIVIYGGMPGQREIILSPKRLTGETEKTLGSQEKRINLGHIGEAHYLSLRPKQWRESLQKGLQKRQEAMKFKYPDTPAEQHSMIKCPIQHINFILRQVFRKDFINSSCSEVADLLFSSRHETKKCVNELFGPVVCQLVPNKVRVKSYEPDISIFFPSVKEGATKECFKIPVVCCVRTPKDTHIVTTMDSAKSVDLLAENATVDIGRAVLIPKRPNLWKGQTEFLNGTKSCLKALDIDPDIFDELLSKKSKEGFLSISQVLGFKCAWPDVAKEWPDRRRESSFPDSHKIQTVVESGCHVIPLIPTAYIADIFDDPVQCMTSTDDHTWCYSFVAAEKDISRSLSSEQRQCFLIFKALVDDSLTDIPIPSSVARNIFFYACEKLDKQFWKSNPGECVLLLLKKLSECFKNCSLPHYFMQEKNLLHFLPEKTLCECFHRLECTRLQPVVSLYFLLDQLNVMSSEIGGFLERIFENIIIEGRTNTKMGPTDRALLPACTDLIQILIYQEDFYGAILVFQDVIEESGGSLKTDGFAEIKRLLWSMPIGFQWCFALLIDIQLHTTITAQLCEENATVHITEMFGPNCTKELPDTLVPECFSIRKGNLKFLLNVLPILSQNVSDNMYIGCLKFFLNQYAEIAGEDLAIPNIEYEIHRTAAVKMKKPIKVASLWNELHDLQTVYVHLFNHCLYSLNIEEFRDMAPAYVKIAETIGSRPCLRNLHIMWSSLGDRKKAEIARKKLSMIEED